MLLGSTDVMIEAEISLDMRSIDSAVVTVYDSSSAVPGRTRLLCKNLRRLIRPLLQQQDRQQLILRSKIRIETKNKFFLMTIPMLIFR